MEEGMDKIYFQDGENAIGVSFSAADTSNQTYFIVGKDQAGWENEIVIHGNTTFDGEGKTYTISSTMKIKGSNCTLKNMTIEGKYYKGFPTSMPLVSLDSEDWEYHVFNGPPYEIKGVNLETHAVQIRAVLHNSLDADKVTPLDSHEGLECDYKMEGSTLILLPNEEIPIGVEIIKKIKNIRFENVTFDGIWGGDNVYTGDNEVVGWSDGIRGYAVENLVIDGCTFKNCNNDGITIKNTFDSWGPSIALNPLNDKVTIVRSSFSSMGISGIDCEADRVVISDSYFEAGVNGAVRLGSRGYQTRLTSQIITNSVFEAPERDCIALRCLGDGNIDHVLIQNCRFNGKRGVYSRATARQITILDSVMKCQEPIRLSSPASVTLERNEIDASCMIWISGGVPDVYMRLISMNNTHIPVYRRTGRKYFDFGRMLLISDDPDETFTYSGFTIQTKAKDKLTYPKAKSVTIQLSTSFESHVIHVFNGLVRSASMNVVSHEDGVSFSPPQGDSVYDCLIQGIY